MALKAGYYGLKRSLFNKVKALPGIKSIGTGLSLNSTTGELEATGATISIEANPEGAATENLTKLGLGDVVYAVSDVTKTYQTDDATESAIVDADYIPFLDSSAASGSGAPKKSTWSNFKSKLKAVFDAYYMTWEANAVLGAYNIINNTMESHEIDGVTFTMNADKSVALSGTSTGDIAHSAPPYKYDVSLDLTNLEKGRYRLSGCPEGGSSTTYRLIISNAATSTFVTDIGNGAVFDYDPDAVDPWVYCYIRINSGQDMTGKVFKPMITTDLNATYDDYVAPAMTNKELTENKYGINKILSSTDDLNNVKEKGIYVITTKPINAPENAAYAMMIVSPTYLEGTSPLIQTIFMGNNIYSRTYAGTPVQWNSWYKYTGTAVS